MLTTRLFLTAALIGCMGCIERADRSAAAQAEAAPKPPPPAEAGPPVVELRKEVAPAAPAKVKPAPVAGVDNPRAAYESKRPEASTLKMGDIVFVQSNTPHANALGVAMPGEFNHCGIIFVTSDGPQVIAADKTTEQLPYDRWLRTTRASRIVVKRLSDETLTVPDKMRPLQIYSLSARGSDYDYGFAWDNARKLYSSEYVHKAFAQGPGVELGKKQTLASLGLTAAAAKKLTEQHGLDIALDALVVTPTSIHDDARLRTVFDSKRP